MDTTLLSAGEFAQLARTTKRTVLWYDQQGILKPKQVDTNGYRYYEPSQIIDFQAILLLRRLKFSLGEVKAYLSKNNSLRQLFKAKRNLLVKEVASLQFALQETDSYYKYLQNNGTLVDPKVKTVSPISIYYLDRIGPYSQIGNYLDDLRSNFQNLPQSATLLTIFEDTGYQPKKARMKIGVTKTPNLKLKTTSQLKELSIPKFKALSHTHTGSSKLLSLLWQELSKFADKKGYKQNTVLGFDDLELYHYVGFQKSPENNGYFAEILLPIK